MKKSVHDEKRPEKCLNLVLVTNPTNKSHLKTLSNQLMTKKKRKPQNYRCSAKAYGPNEKKIARTNIKKYRL